MIYFLLPYLASSDSFGMVLPLGLRAMGALLTAFLLFLLSGGRFIAYCTTLFASGERQYLPENHKKKSATPTMGGLLMYSVVVGTCLLWTDLTQFRVWLFLANYTIFAALGFYDDWCKVTQKAGISARTKFLFQLGGALFVTGLWVYVMSPDTHLWFPLFRNLSIDLGPWLLVLWAAFVIIGSSNAVNLTDGLDGLAIGSLIPVFATFSLIAFLISSVEWYGVNLLGIMSVHATELVIIGASFVGASLGFLWFNTYPAQIFMGDVGSLSLGAALAFMALMLKEETLLPIAGGIFVLEVLSVMAQVLSFRLRKKRLFKMAPLHHHFELLGWPETKITMRFNVLSMIFCLLALTLLFLKNYLHVHP